VAPDHLPPGVPQEGLQAEPTPALGDERQKERRVEHIPELLLQFVPAAAADRFKDLPGFLNQVRQERMDGLRPVPCAAAWALEAPGGRDQRPERI
jgi:hypothetical protein